MRSDLILAFHNFNLHRKCILDALLQLVLVLVLPLSVVAPMLSVLVLLPEATLLPSPTPISVYIDYIPLCYYRHGYFELGV